jgi:hypothetical protein
MKRSIDKIFHRVEREYADRVATLSLWEIQIRIWSNVKIENHTHFTHIKVELYKGKYL